MDEARGLRIAKIVDELIVLSDELVPESKLTADIRLRAFVDALRARRRLDGQGSV